MNIKWLSPSSAQQYPQVILIIYKQGTTKMNKISLGYCKLAMICKNDFYNHLHLDDCFLYETTTQWFNCDNQPIKVSIKSRNEILGWAPIE